jgi:hypothetical protein
VAIDTVGGNVILGECKYTDTPKGLSVLHKLKEKADAIKSLTRANDVFYILFSKAGFTQGLIDESKRDVHIKLIEKLSEKYTETENET